MKAADLEEQVKVVIGLCIVLETTLYRKNVELNISEKITM